MPEPRRKPGPRQGAPRKGAPRKGAPRKASSSNPPPRRAPRRETSRSVAIAALVRAEDGGYANLDVPARLGRTRLSDRDRAWVTGAVYGTLRRQRYLDDLLAPHSNRSIAELEPAVRAALRLGAYQLVEGVPAHAAVAETVGAAPERARGYVNGVLRSLDRKGRPWPAPSGLGQRLSYPDWIVDELTEAFGAEDAERALEAMNEPGAVTLRVNLLRGDRAAVLRELEVRGATTSAGTLVDDAIVVVGTGDLERLRSVREGQVTPQDQASQAVVRAVDAQAGDRVLDVASAPGGKATGVAERMGDTGLVVATDLHASRLRLVREAAGRLHLASIQALVASGAQLPFAAGSFDRVLLDAPCSGLGVLRRRPEARWRVQPAQVEQLAELQCSLLAHAAAMVRPGGRLVYSVCTVTRAETLDIDAWAERELTDFEAVPVFAAPWRAHGRGALVLPHDAGTDGMFVLVLERRGTTAT
jgi:16S rRNA (cytosine967-C5)-methyltransferase